MSVVRVLRAVNQVMKARMPSLALEIGNARLSSPGNQRLIWKIAGGPRLGGIQTDDGATVLDVRAITCIAEIRIKRPTPGITDADYELAEEVIRNLEIALRTVASADFVPGIEDWSGTSEEPDGAGVTVRIPYTFNVKVKDDPWRVVAPDQDPTAQGELNNANQIG